MEREFNYGQWTVTLKRKNAGLSWVDGKPLEDHISIDVVGNWRVTQGILYDKHRNCCAYDEPELLPKGLKKRIYETAMKMLEKEVA